MTSRNTKESFVIRAIVIVALLGVIAAVSHFVWLPDILTVRVIVLSKVIRPNGDYMRIVQLFNGDGYLTEFIQTDQAGRRWSVVIDPDARKAWSASLSESTNGKIDIRIWNRQLSYDPEAHIMSGLSALPLTAYEIPQGTPITPPR
jgi:hypothetical protein